jgi:hypothetical protein
MLSIVKSALHRPVNRIITRQLLVQALAGPAVPSRPERAIRKGGAFVIDAFFMGAADNLVGHDNRLGSGPRYERQHFFDHPDVVADVGLLL